MGGREKKRKREKKGVREKGGERGRKRDRENLEGKKEDIKAKEQL